MFNFMINYIRTDSQFGLCVIVDLTQSSTWWKFNQQAQLDKKMILYCTEKCLFSFFISRFLSKIIQNKSLFD